MFQLLVRMDGWCLNLNRAEVVLHMGALGMNIWKKRRILTSSSLLEEQICEEIVSGSRCHGFGIYRINRA